MLISNFGRALRHHPADRQAAADRAAGARARRDRRRAPRRPRRRGPRARRRAGRRACTRSPTATRRRCSAASSSTGPWADVAQAVQVSAYSLKALAVACQPLMPPGGSVVGLTFDATVAWPAYDWMGVAKAALESTSRYLARDLGPEGIRVNLVAAGPLKTPGRQGDPRLRGLRGDVGDPRAARLGREPTSTPTARAVVALLSRLLPARPPARSCTSTAASTRWGPSRCGPGGLAEREPCLTGRAAGAGGPEPLLPAGGGQADAGHQRLRGCPTRPPRGSRAGSGCATPAPEPPGPASGSGSRPGPWPGWYAAVAAESGTAGSPSACGPTSDLHQIVVAFPWRHRDRAQALGRAVAERARRAARGGHRRRGQRGRRRGVAAVRAGRPPPAPSRRAIPVVAVTGTNGKTTTSRMIAHIGRTAGLLVGWSSTDGIYVDGELVEAGDYSGPSGAGRVLAHPEVAARGDRDRPRRHPAQGHRRDPQRRLGGHQRQRRPPRASRASTPSTSWPRSRRSSRGSPARTAGRCSTATTRGCFAMRRRDQGPAVGVLPRPRLAGDPRGARRAAAAPRP